MTRLGRGQRIAVGVWLVVAAVAWNGIYDVLLARSTQHYLFRTAMHDAGLAPAVDLTAALDYAVLEATWLATLWAGILLLAGLVTIRLSTPRQPSRP
jgi:hypothetical protein